ncbi:MAG: hypothetical protein ACP5P9_01135, partial [Acidimicrobiales bacterium]
MSDVDAIRSMASEHDLEFVDLDRYSVDPAAADVLPEAVARQYQAVPVKRRFGTPVIAIADPDDVAAADAVREAIGRDFISVVAVPSQIASCLDRQYGGGVDRHDEAWGVGASDALSGSSVVDGGSGPVDLPADDLDAADLFGVGAAATDTDFGLVAPGASGDPLLAEAASALVPDLGEMADDDDVDDTLGLSLFGSAFVNAGPSEAAPAPPAAASPDVAFDASAPLPGSDPW